LHRHDIGQLQLKFEYFLYRYGAFAGRNRRAQGIQHRCLPGLRPAGHENVQSGDDTRLEKVRWLRGYGVQGDQLVQRRDAQHKLADVHRQMSARDLRDYHVQSGAVREHRVDKGSAQIDPPAGTAEHSLDEVGNLIAG
jgi:hypothetical protein